MSSLLESRELFFNNYCIIENMAKKKGRYFYRNTGEAHLADMERQAIQNVAAEPISVELLSTTESIRNSADLPHYSGLIPARAYQGFLFGMYSLITFTTTLIVLFTWLKPPAVNSLPAYSLIHSPASSESHLKYLEWLVQNYRLRDVEREQKYIAQAKSKGWYKGLNEARLQSINAETSKKEEIFRLLVSEYAYWLRTNKEYPNYRDGLYRGSQLSYMLLNDVEPKNLLKSSVRLDPQFQLATQVESQL